MWLAVRAGHYVDEVTLWLIILYLYDILKPYSCEVRFYAGDELGEIILEFVAPGRGLRRIG